MDSIPFTAAMSSLGNRIISMMSCLQKEYRINQDTGDFSSRHPTTPQLNSPVPPVTHFVGSLRFVKTSFNVSPSLGRSGGMSSWPEV